jgi:hypothetical protein
MIVLVVVGVEFVRALSHNMGSHCIWPKHEAAMHGTGTLYPVPRSPNRSSPNIAVDSAYRVVDNSGRSTRLLLVSVSSAAHTSIDTSTTQSKSMFL